MKVFSEDSTSFNICSTFITQTVEGQYTLYNPSLQGTGEVFACLASASRLGSVLAGIKKHLSNDVRESSCRGLSISIGIAEKILEHSVVHLHTQQNVCRLNALRF
jgi:hypothetical protein